MYTLFRRLFCGFYEFFKIFDQNIPISEVQLPTQIQKVAVLNADESSHKIP